MFLKTYDGGDVEDLCLTFTVADEEFGANREASLLSFPFWSRLTEVLPPVKDFSQRSAYTCHSVPHPVRRRSQPPTRVELDLED